MQRETQILILCIQAGVQDLGSPKSPILDGLREGDRCEERKALFVTENFLLSSVVDTVDGVYDTVTQEYASILWLCSTKKENGTKRRLSS